MSQETTTTSLNDLTNSALVQPVVIAALSEMPGLWKLSREFAPLTDQATSAASIATETSWWGSANDDGAGVDTEMNATEGTDLSNTQAATGTVTVTAAEYGVAMEVTDNVVEDSVRGIDVFNWLEGRHLHAINLAMTDDFIALFASISNSVGSSGSDLTVIQAIAAQQGVRVRGAVSDTSIYVLDNEQQLNLDTALLATSTSMAVYALAADRVIGFSTSPDNGMGAMRNTMSLRNFPAYTSGLTDLANASADVVGCFFCGTSAANDANGATTFGHIWKRLPRLETDRIIIGRSTLMVTTAKWGCAELQDGSGSAIITDAP
jgi:hypothetical protein